MGKMRNIIVVPHNPLWPEQFRREAALISAIFGEALISIHHIGSTAIPGLSAKPVLDIMPLVRDISKVETYNRAMMDAGYQPKGEYGIVGRRFFVKGGEADRTHHLHVYERDHSEVERHLAFRDYLAAHPDEAQEYGLLKKRLAREFRDDIDGYMAGKDSFIKGILAKVHAWRETNG